MPDSAAIPARPGSYVLLLSVERPLALDGRFEGAVLAPGKYAYAGSARGPGGLRARLGRHLGREKPVHWHIDRVTAVARVEALGTSERLSECALVSRLASLAGASIPVPGFGSSDCRSCAAHLVAIGGGAVIDIGVDWIEPAG